MISCGNVLELSSEYLDGSIWWVSCTGAGVLFSSWTQGSLRLPQRSLRDVDGLLLLRRIRCMAINPRSSPLYVFSISCVSKNDPHMRPWLLLHSKGQMLLSRGWGTTRGYTTHP
jgi:hypothetical protein